MARLPQPGADNGTWGEVLNDFLSTAHNTDGSLKDIPQSKITSLTTSLAGKLDVSQKGTANGIASLDGTGKLLDTQVPTRLGASELNTTITTAAYSKVQADTLFGRRPKTIIFIGDSLTEQGGMIAAAPQIKPYSAWPWAMAMLGQRLRVLKNAGIGGQTTTEILTRFDTDVVDLQPEWVHILAGTNNMGSALAQAKTDILAMLDKANAAGIKVLLGTIPPRISASYTGASKANTLEFNRWIVAISRTRANIILVDYFSALSDNDGKFRGTIAGRNPTSDGVHLSAMGGYISALVLAAALRPFTVANYPYLPRVGDGQLLNNSDFFDGSANSSPTSWTVGGAVSGWSQVQRPELPSHPWKQLVIANGAGTVTLSGNSPVGSNGLAIGDSVCAFIEYELTGLDQAAATGQQAFHIAIRMWNGTSYFSTLASMEDYNSPNLDRSGALFVPEFVIPPTTTVVTLVVTMVGGGTYRLGRVGLYKPSSLTP